MPYPDNGVLLSCTEQESNQRSRLGGDADREAYRYFLGLVTHLPRLQAALPQVPLSAPVVTWSVVDLWVLSIVGKKRLPGWGAFLFMNKSQV